MNDEPADQRPAQTAPRTEPRGTRSITVESLMAGARELVIVHREERYRLRLTQNGKLILTK